MTDCSTVSDERWINERFPGRCYFYPGRDCPGWEPDGTCGRIGTHIPPDADNDNGPA